MTMTLREWRRKVGKSVDDVAAILKADRHTVYRWEQGKLMPQTKFMERICAMTDGECTIGDFYQGLRRRSANDDTAPGAA